MFVPIEWMVYLATLEYSVEIKYGDSFIKDRLDLIIGDLPEKNLISKSAKKIKPIRQHQI